MFRSDARRFVFRAHAVGVSGTFNKPYREYLDAQASCALGITGGTASAVVKGFSYRNIISFSLAESHILGQPGDAEGSHTTLSTVNIEGFNVMNMLTCGRIVTRLSSRSFSDKTQAAFVAVGSHFEKLRVAGQDVTVELDDNLLSGWDTYKEARDGLQKRDGVKIPDGTMFYGSIVRKISEPKGTKVTGNRIDIPHFGSIYLGEIYIDLKSRRLDMVRIAFGCPVDGNGNAGGVENNGETYPPLAG